MNCPKCQKQNEENAKFCNNCGSVLNQMQDTGLSRKKTDLLILIFLSYMFISSLAEFVLEKFFDYKYEEASMYIRLGLNIIWAFSPILLGMAIKNKTGKIIGVLLASLYALYVIYTNINWIIQYAE